MEVEEKKRGERSPMNRLRLSISARMGVALGLGAALWVATSCGEIEATEQWPSGAALLANTRSLDRLLGRLAQLEGTPLARQAGRLRASLPDCPIVEARAESGQWSDLWSGLACATGSADWIALEQARNGWDIAASVRVADGHGLGLLSISATGDVELELRLPRVAGEGLAGLALPGREAAGAAELSEAETLIHVRVRPEGGLDLASLVPSNSQGAHLFRLKSELFAGLALDGVWEVATYLPEEGDSMPRTALALNFSNRSAAIAAMEDFITNLQESWPVARTFFRLGEADGACLLDLAVMPGLAPCYVATQRALVVGWNPASLRKALDGRSGERAELGNSSAAIIHLDRFADADRILSSALSVETSPRPTQYPWKRITAKGAPDASGFRLQLRFESGLGT
jgi:hypothetical protein